MTREENKTKQTKRKENIMEAKIFWAISQGHCSLLRLLLLLLLLSHFSRVRLCDPIDCSPPGSRSLGFSRQEHWSGLPFPSPMHETGMWKLKEKSLSRVQLLTTPWTAAHQAFPSMGFSRQYWSGVPLPSPSIELRVCKMCHAWVESRGQQSFCNGTKRK